jgi:16S rRNA (uracil1498-N3)-methyltransferase
LDGGDLLTRLFLESVAEGTARVGAADYRYLARVLRLGPGAEVTVFDGQGREAPARIQTIDAAREEVVLVVASPRRAVMGLPITLIVALLKADKMDLVVQKATELGVHRIVPVAAARSVVHLDEGRAAGRVARWRKIAREAARQCGRADAPVVELPRPVRDAVVDVPTGAWKAIFHEGVKGASLRKALPPERPAAAVVAVGPEGGFDAAEVEAAQAAGFVAVGLGPRILRAETAALAAVVAIGFALGDLA